MRRKGLLWTGALLIAAGAVLLLRSTGWVKIGLEVFITAALAAAGAVWAVRGTRAHAPGRVFFGTFLMLVAGFAFLRLVWPDEISSYYLPPVSLLALGLAFLAAYASSPGRFPLLVGALIFCPLAAGIWLVELGYLDRREVFSAVGEYWPVAVMLLGVSLLIPRRAT